MPPLPDREVRAKLRLAARSYRKAKAKYAARPSPKRAARVAACRAELIVLLEQSRDSISVAA